MCASKEIVLGFTNGSTAILKIYRMKLALTNFSVTHFENYYHICASQCSFEKLVSVQLNAIL